MPSDLNLDPTIGNWFTAGTSFAVAGLLLRLLIQFQRTFLSSASQRIRELEKRIRELEDDASAQRDRFDDYLRRKEAEFNDRFVNLERQYMDRLAQKESTLTQLRDEIDRLNARADHSSRVRTELQREVKEIKNQQTGED